MKEQKKLSIKVRDLEPLKDVTGGRRIHRAHGRAGVFVDRDLLSEYRSSLGLFRGRLPQ